ncbi:DUF1995 family protein [Oscillatoria sp. FACHB-1407]|uniref:DUF1995 family protein n=1 Tax=Oscillatoria sp. FACHB-1407 TaxID=2692847 RepID=UPI001683B7AD|nr:DUF1995 family protein [Oscillatoria sp. FACHB-1407]MBD2461202.1 DUF1995 family protein [Oscillatoria sp. FACHB-1407]
MTQLPQNLDDAIAQAREATKAAIADGLTRLQVELVFPELKIMPVAEQFIPAFEDLGDRFRVFFPDPGSAALARRDWGEKPYAIRGIGELKAVIQPEEEVFLFVEPSSVEVTQVEQLCEEAQQRPVVLLNPRLEDIAIIGIGYAARQLRERLLNTFESCYYIRPLEGAALFRCYPSPWQVWRETENGYELIAEEPQKPIGETLERILFQGTDTEAARPAPRKGFLAGLQEFLRALSQ